MKYVSDWTVNARDWIDCRLTRFIMHTSVHLSASFLVIMSAEKCFALYFPIKSKTMCSVKNAIKVSIINVLVFVSYNLQWFFTLEKKYVKKLDWVRCQIQNASEFFKLHWRDMDAMVASYIPIALMTLFNSAIIMLLCLNRSTNLGVGSSSRDMSKIAKQVTIMLLSVTCVFIALKLPVAIYLHVVGIHIRNDPIANSVLTNLVYVNSGINSFLYMFSGSKYRETVLDMFKCCTKKNKGKIRLPRTSESGTKETSVSVVTDGTMAESSN